MSKNKGWKPNGSFVMRRLELMQSPAWLAAPRPLKCMLEVLEVELMRHAGTSNGELFVSYGQFIELAGVNRGTVALMIRVGEELGLLGVNRNTGTGRGDIRDSCAYLLTYLPSGTGRHIAPTDPWKRIKSKEQAEAIVNRLRSAKKKNQHSDKVQKMAEAA